MERMKGPGGNSISPVKRNPTSRLNGRAPGKGGNQVTWIMTREDMGILKSGSVPKIIPPSADPKVTAKPGGVTAHRIMTGKEVKAKGIILPNPNDHNPNIPGMGMAMKVPAVLTVQEIREKGDAIMNPNIEIMKIVNAHEANGPQARGTARNSKALNTAAHRKAITGRVEDLVTFLVTNMVPGLPIGEVPVKVEKIVIVQKEIDQTPPFRETTLQIKVVFGERDPKTSLNVIIIEGVDLREDQIIQNGTIFLVED